MFLLGFNLYGTLCLLDLIDYFLFHVGEIFNYNLFKNFLIPFLFLFFWGPIIRMLVHLILSQKPLQLSWVLFIAFTLFCSSEVISTILSSSSLIRSSASDILLLIPSSIFLISVIVLFVSACLFFNSYRALLVDIWIFSILFSRFLIIFTLIILNSFSGSLTISSLFIWTSVFILCSFTCVVFFCLSFLFCLFVWGLLFPGFKVEFFLPFGSCPPKVGPVVCVTLYMVRFVLRCFVCLFVCFSSNGQGWVSLVILSADDWVCIFVLFVV